MKVLEGEGIYIFLLKKIHENISTGWWVYHTHDTAFNLKIVIAVEHKVV